MSDNFAIKVDNVSKSFKLPHEKSSSIKASFINFYRRNKGFERQQVLDNITFEVEKGEFFGIVGRNGSGKSTLLKLMAGIYSPDKGEVHTRGKLTPFIELGVGFNPELSGRENVYLNGALLGFNRKEMEAMYKEIVEFAELERFMDQKLKNYSSGMQVRLAFSIAIQAKSDVLVLDEVLAVGDEAFQQKCISVFEQYKAQGQTIILVTHDMSVVERFCSRAMMLKEGEIVKIGSSRAVAHLYSEINKEAYANQKLKQERRQNEEIQISIKDQRTKKDKKRFQRGETALIKLSWKRADVGDAGVALMKQSGEYIFGPNTKQDRYALTKGTHEIYYALQLDVGPGEYFLKAGLFSEQDSKVLEFVDDGPSIIVEQGKDQSSWGGIAFLPHAWGGKDVKL